MNLQDFVAALDDAQLASLASIAVVVIQESIRREVERRKADEK